MKLHQRIAEFVKIEIKYQQTEGLFLKNLTEGKEK